MAEEVGLGRRVNMVMQSAFFALSGVMSMEKVRAAGGSWVCGCAAAWPSFPSGFCTSQTGWLLGAVAVTRPTELLMRWAPALRAATPTLPLSSARPAAGHPAA